MEKTIRFQGPCDGAKDLMMSYRTELSGILSTLYLLCTFVEFSHRTIMSAPALFCDNSVAVSCTEKPIYPGIREHLAADYD
eukprot:11643441-Ditylum_brightwellii.AAC.1